MASKVNDVVVVYRFQSNSFQTPLIELSTRSFLCNGMVSSRGQMWVRNVDRGLDLVVVAPLLLPQTTNTVNINRIELRAALLLIGWQLLIVQRFQTD